MLNLLAAFGKTDLQIERVGAAEILRGAIERNQGRHFGRQALLEISGFERDALDGDRAMGRRTGEPDRRQGAGGAVRTNAGENADAHVAARRRFQFAFARIYLRENIMCRNAERNDCRQPAPRHRRFPLIVRGAVAIRSLQAPLQSLQQSDFAEGFVLSFRQGTIRGLGQ
jgi:hypothetical protein